MNDNWMAVTRMNDMYVCHLIPFRDHLWFHILVCSNHNWSSKFKTTQMHSSILSISSDVTLIVSCKKQCQNKTHNNDISMINKELTSIYNSLKSK